MANMALFDVAIQRCLGKFHIDNLKEQQRKCIENILANVDVLAVLPTGYGKSLIYQILPSIYEEMYMLTHGEVHDGTSANSKQYCIIVVSPLEYIREQQVLKLNSLDCGINAVSIGDSKETDELIESGFYNIVYGSAEQWLLPKWKSCLQFGSLHKAKVLVVDEAHTVETW
jgi:ATP-dependent DNA helicase RecQ